MKTKTLTEKDLMIGDWVMYDPNVFIEDEYEPHKEPYPSQIQSAEEIADAVNECYSPLPLTAEILEKNGFIKTVWDTFVLCNSEFGVERIERGFFARIPGARICEIKSVSHLQHLLRDLGVDKEIVL